VNWRRVVMLNDCADCEFCGEAICAGCGDHYADCDCPGPMQFDEYEYTEIDGVLMARPLPESD
jgi:hypothetical protein